MKIHQASRNKNTKTKSFLTCINDKILLVCEQENRTIRTKNKKL